MSERVIVAWSGGKDSASLYDLVRPFVWMMVSSFSPSTAVVRFTCRPTLG
ncbi:MAG: hypothetical protein KKB90_08115 [Actinobacteria bacterium]|nr:hypothetical protein [Actinomycetota bacterium]MCG2817640.1 hypothetical protein [Actinomycetes bacterium]MBU4179400.1 hypothetical protein [Actinomycetota bacterium]MBU4218910.1 hypothetical protein [Actinomycetota bacterium]MBU4358510.1 hypothetical protein [Actinomycetota bacterium]